MPFRASALPFAAALTLALAACGGAGGGGEHGSPTMRPGEDCLGCHDGQTATRYTAAGTVYSNANGTAAVSGASVVIAYGTNLSQTLSTTTNSAGNFFFTQAFTYPATVTVTGVGLNMSMPNAGFAGCNSCHTVAGQGRVH